MYIAASMSIADKISEVEDALRTAGIRYYSPRELIPSSTPKSKMPEIVLKRCTEHIIRADGMVVLLDYYGKDTSFEIGFARGIGKKVIGYCTDSRAEASFAEDYMLRNSIVLVAHSLEELTTEVRRLFVRLSRHNERAEIKNRSR